MDKATVRDLLAAAIETLMDHHGETLEQTAKRTKVGYGTIARIRNGDVGVSVDTLEAVAAGYRVQPWQLLVPDFKKDALPQLLDPVDEGELELIRLYRSMHSETRPSLLERAKKLAKADEPDVSPTTEPAPQTEPEARRRRRAKKGAVLRAQKRRTGTRGL